MTGATGYLGSHLLHALLLKGYDVVALKRQTSSLERLSSALQNFSQQLTLTNLEDTDLSQVIRDYRISTTIHCATDYGRTPKPFSSILQANLILPLQILEAGLENGVKIFINTDTILDKRINEYSLSKRQFYEWMSAFKTKARMVNISLEHFYGPNDDTSKFVSAMMEKMLKNVPKIPLTPGEQRRDFIHIDDVVRAFLTILDHHHFDLTSVRTGIAHYEVGSGVSISIRELVSLIKELSGNTATELQFGALPYRDNEVMEYSVRLEPLLALGWRPQVSLREGLMQTLSLTRENL